MCLAVPGQVTEIEGTTATVDIQGNITQADISIVSDVQVGDYVIVHAGFAIEKYDEKEALVTLDLMRELAESREKDGPPEV